MLSQKLQHMQNKTKYRHTTIKLYAENQPLIKITPMIKKITYINPQINHTLKGHNHNVHRQSSPDMHIEMAMERTWRKSLVTSPSKVMVCINYHAHSHVE